MTSAINPSSPQPPGTGLESKAPASEVEAVSAQDRQEIAAAGNSVQAGAAEADLSVAEATRNIADYIQTVSRSLQISVDGDLGETVITVFDSSTEEVVRQIPSEEVLEMARYISSRNGTNNVEDSPVLGLLINREG
ncbi:MAG: flagellar protein FlaG [Pseudomonadota bacterium]